MTPKFKWLLFCLVCLSFQKSPVFKNTSIWQALKQVHSDHVEFWRGSVWAKATCDMYAQRAIIRCCYWMNSYIYSTDRLSEAGKVLVYCSQNINATHLSTCARCNSKHAFFFFALCMCVCVCVWACVMSSKALLVLCICMTLLRLNVQNDQVNPVISETTFTTRWEATYDGSQQFFNPDKQKGGVSWADFRINKWWEYFLSRQRGTFFFLKRHHVRLFVSLITTYQ